MLEWLSCPGPFAFKGFVDSRRFTKEEYCDFVETFRQNSTSRYLSDTLNLRSAAKLVSWTSRLVRS